LIGAFRAYLRRIDPRLPRAVWTMEARGLVNAFGNGITFPIVAIYLHNVRGFALAGVFFGLGECFQGLTQGALVADLAPARLRGRYMALSTMSWEIGFVIGPAIGGFILDRQPLALWPLAAGGCLLAGVGALALERGIPRELRLTPA
jgi:MFS family permease